MDRISKAAVDELKKLHLKPRQEKVVLAYAAHRGDWSKEKMYLAAGYAQNNARSRGAQIVNGIVNRPDVSAWLQKFDKAADDKAAEKMGKKILSVAERKEMLTDIAAQNRGKRDIISIKALDILNKMDSVYVQKNVVSGDSRITICWGGEDKDGS